MTPEQSKEYAENKDAIVQLRRNLRQIAQTGKCSVPISLTMYTKLGLITVRHKNVTMPSGRVEKIFDRLLLTEKGKRMIAVTLP